MFPKLLSPAQPLLNSGFLYPTLLNIFTWIANRHIFKNQHVQNWIPDLPQTYFTVSGNCISIILVTQTKNFRIILDSLYTPHPGHQQIIFVLSSKIIDCNILLIDLPAFTFTPLHSVLNIAVIAILLKLWIMSVFCPKFYGLCFTQSKSQHS